MVNKLVDIDLPEEVWKIIDNQFKLNKESDSELLSTIIRNYIAEHGFYPDIHSLAHGNGIKDYLDIHAIMIESIVELLDKKDLVPSKEFAEVMDQKMMNE
jgi:metal-responsive CopG/Arc/MetJ family transcriptional regulator